jgi:hypothetical protein
MLNIEDEKKLKKLAKLSQPLYEKALAGKLPIDRALKTAETIKKIESRGFKISEEQHQRLADYAEEDERLIEKFERETLSRIKDKPTE